MFYHMSVRKYGPIRTANIGYTEPLLVLFFGFMAYSDAGRLDTSDAADE